MQGVFPAERTILVQFKTIRGVLLVLHGIVVPLLAFAAPEGDLYPHFGTSCFVASLFGFVGSGRFSAQKQTRPTTGDEIIAQRIQQVND